MSALKKVNISLYIIQLGFETKTILYFPAMYYEYVIKCQSDSKSGLILEEVYICHSVKQS